MLLLVIEEPGGKTILGVEGVAVKAVVDEVCTSFLAVDEGLREGDGFCCNKTVFFDLAVSVRFASNEMTKADFEFSPA